MTKHDDELRQLLDISLTWHEGQTFPLQIGEMRLRGWKEFLEALRLWLPLVEKKAHKHGNGWAPDASDEAER